MGNGLGLPSIETPTSLSLGARKRNVTLLSACTSGEINGGGGVCAAAVEAKNRIAIKQNFCLMIPLCRLHTSMWGRRNLSRPGREPGIFPLWSAAARHHFLVGGPIRRAPSAPAPSSPRRAMIQQTALRRAVVAGLQTLFAERGWTIRFWSTSQRPAGRSVWIYQTGWC